VKVGQWLQAAVTWDGTLGCAERIRLDKNGSGKTAYLAVYRGRILTGSMRLRCEYGGWTGRRAGSRRLTRGAMV
jgi:hypothetical protein